jgi:hypothetical protein
MQKDAIWDTTLTDKRWRTLKGLRIGDRVQRLMRLYPASYRAKGGWWGLILEDILGIGDPKPMLSARVVNGRVTKFAVWFPAGGI